METKQIFIAQKGSPIAFKVVPHNTDETMLVLKARHPEVGSLVAMSAGIAASSVSTSKGGKYFLTFLPRKDLEKGLGKVLLDVLAGNLQLAPTAAVPVYEDLSSAHAGPDDEEEEDDDGEEEDSDDGDY